MAKKVRIKNLQSVERLGTIDDLCNKETGTLTTSIMTVQHWCDYDQDRENNMLVFSHLLGYHNCTVGAVRALVTIQNV